MNRNLNRRIHPIAEANGLSPKFHRKACDWLHLNLPNIEYTIKEPKPLRVSRGLLIDELKKAIEE